MKLSQRLQYIADFVKKSTFIADIGTDHAYIPIYLIKNNICNRAIATDVKSGPLHKAEKNISLYRLNNLIQVRKGYGLSPVNKGEVDGAILAGMGGYLICDILEKGSEIADTIEYFIIQPMQAPEAVRLYLMKNNYKIIDEILVKENDKIYEILFIEHGSDIIDDEIYFEIGRKLIEKKDPLLKELIISKIRNINNIIEKIENKKSHNALQRMNECNLKLNKYYEVLKCL